MDVTHRPDRLAGPEAGGHADGGAIGQRYHRAAPCARANESSNSNRRYSAPLLWLLKLRRCVRGSSQNAVETEDEGAVLLIVASQHAANNAVRLRSLPLIFKNNFAELSHSLCKRNTQRSSFELRVCTQIND
jgi:hypothetical protein